MLHAAEQAGVTHLVGHEFRWAPERALVARAIADGLDRRASDVLDRVSTCRSSPIPSTRMPQWWFDPAQRRRLARRVGLARRRPGPDVARRDRVSERGVARRERPRRCGRRQLRRSRDVTRSGAHGVIQQTAASWIADRRSASRSSRGPTARSRSPATGCTCPTGTGGARLRSRPILRSRARRRRRPTTRAALHAPRARSVHAAVRSAACGRRAASDRHGRRGPDVRRRRREQHE